MNKLSLLVIAMAVLLSGCASTPLDPQANRIISSTNPAPKGCKYLGQVVGNQGNFVTGSWTSNRNLEEGAMNNLKNEANKLGANYVQLVTTRAGNTGAMSGADGSYSGHSSQTNVTNVGNAYICAPASIGL